MAAFLGIYILGSFGIDFIGRPSINFFLYWFKIFFHTVFDGEMIQRFGSFPVGRRVLLTVLCIVVKPPYVEVRHSADPFENCETHIYHSVDFETFY